MAFERKILSIVPDKCVSCETCKILCSFEHEKTHKPSMSRIFVVRREPNTDTPVICVHCGLCMQACPIDAMKRDPKTGAIVVKENCNGCGQCIMACPYGVIFQDPETSKAIKCDLCGGAPQCIKCPYDALVYVEQERGTRLRRINTAIATGRKTPIYEKNLIS